MTRFIDSMLDWISGHFTLFNVLFLAVVIAPLVALAVLSERAWDQWSEAHHCEVIGHVSPSNSFGFTADGKFAQIYVPAKTGWKCDDGQEYWR